MSILDTFVALDLETTGLSPEDAEILEIGAAKVEGGEVTDRFQTYVKPRQGIPEESVRSIRNRCATRISPGHRN